MNIDKTKKIAYEIIMSFPKAKNGQPYLALASGRKVFFNRFIKKYGIDGRKTNYSGQDLTRRANKTEFFKYFLSKFALSPGRANGRLLLDSHFHRMVIIETKVGQAKKLELLSFYPL